MEDLQKYIVHLGDCALILGHRNSEWTGHGPVLEQDIALSNIALDLIGQARNFYQYAAELIEGGTTEDSLAYQRDAIDYTNCLLLELPNGNWGKTILRQFFFSTYQFFLYQKLQHSSDTRLAAISEKSFKEVTYHLNWSAEWVIRLGDGTEESHAKMKTALLELWPFTGELFEPADYEITLAADKIIPDVSSFQSAWQEKIMEVLSEATLFQYLENELKDSWMQRGGKNGVHTEHLGYLLAEMQFLQRAYPGAEW